MEYTLVTGGCGYIGSHVCIELIQSMPEMGVIIVDNLMNSKANILHKIQQISNCKKDQLVFFKLNVASPNLSIVFENYNVTQIIHLAGFKSVRESIENPLLYYDVNITTTVNLVKHMLKYKCHKLIFSSSATVYGNVTDGIISDNDPFAKLDFNFDKNCIQNPYGSTKLMNERILYDCVLAHPELCIVSLRYFNPIGFHPSGILKENFSKKNENLMPHIVKSVLNETVLKIFGNNYKTKDGTCCRDFIHVMDVANAHTFALNKIQPGYDWFNIGTGVPTSVKSLVSIFEKTNSVKVNYEFCNKRKGDVPVLYCDTKKANRQLGWKCKYNIYDMCKDSWNAIK